MPGTDLADTKFAVSDLLGNMLKALGSRLRALFDAQVARFMDFLTGRLNPVEHLGAMCQ